MKVRLTLTLLHALEHFSSYCVALCSLNVRVFDYTCWVLLCCVWLLLLGILPFPGVKWRNSRSGGDGRCGGTGKRGGKGGYGQYVLCE